MHRMTNTWSLSYRSNSVYIESNSPHTSLLVPAGGALSHAASIYTDVYLHYLKKYPEGNLIFDIHILQSCVMCGCVCVCACVRVRASVFLSIWHEFHLWKNMFLCPCVCLYAGMSFYSVFAHVHIWCCVPMMCHACARARVCCIACLFGTCQCVRMWWYVRVHT